MTVPAACACILVWRLLSLAVRRELVWFMRVALWAAFARGYAGVHSLILLPVAGVICEFICAALWSGLTGGVEVRRHRSKAVSKFKPMYSPIPELMPARSYDPKQLAVGGRLAGFKRRAQCTASHALASSHAEALAVGAIPARAR